MPSLSQLRLRTERVNHQVIELQSDLRAIERRIRILESRAVGGNSRTVSRDLENAQSERSRILEDLTEAQQARHNLEELVKLHDGQMSSCEGSGNRSMSSTPSKNKSGSMQTQRAAINPVTLSEKSGSPARHAQRSIMVAQHPQKMRAATSCRATRRVPNQIDHEACSAPTCTVSTSTTFLPQSTAPAAKASLNTVDAPIPSFVASPEALPMRLIPGNVPIHGTTPDQPCVDPRTTASQHRPPTSPSPSPPSCFHLPLPPQPHVLSPQPSNLSSPPVSPTRHPLPAGPAMPDSTAPPGPMLTYMPDSTAAVQSWLIQQPEYWHGTASPGSVHRWTQGPPQLFTVHTPPPQPLPTSYHPQPLHPMTPMSPRTWYTSPGEAAMQPNCSLQAAYPVSAQQQHQCSPQALPRQQPPPAAAEPSATCASAADVSKVESWLRAVGRARGWDLKLLDDLLAQDLAAVLASDCPQADATPGTRGAAHAPPAPMHTRSNPLALQQFVSECAGRPRSGQQATGTAATLVTAVHKHLLRRSGTPTAHQHASLLRQSFDLLECGAARARGHAAGVASRWREDPYTASDDKLWSGQLQGQSERSESFPGFQQAGDVSRSRTLGERGSEGSVVDMREQHKLASPTPGCEVYEGPPVTGDLAGAAGGAAWGMEERPRRETASMRGSPYYSMPGLGYTRGGRVAGAGVAVSTAENDWERRPAGPWKGVQVAQGRKAPRGGRKVVAGREPAQAGHAQERQPQAPPPQRAELPVHGSPRAPAQQVGPTIAVGRAPAVAALVRPPCIQGDMDAPLVALARRATVHSHRLELTVRDATETLCFRPWPMRWIAAIFSIVLFRRRRRLAPSACTDGAGQPAKPQLPSCSSATNDLAQCGHDHKPQEKCEDRTERTATQAVRRSHTRVTRSALFRAQAPRILHAIYEDGHMIEDS
eukprot:jgi/Ulvmu1/7953/UM004_0186.1